MQRVGDRQRVEQLDQVRRVDVTDRGTANRLHQFERLAASLISDDVAECAPQQADVVVERLGLAHRSRIRDGTDCSAELAGRYRRFAS